MKIAITASVGGLKPAGAFCALMEELEARNLRQNVIAYAGSSGGSIWAALAASGMTAKQMTEALLSINDKRMWEDWDWGYPVTALLRTITMRKPLAGFTGLMSGNKVRTWLQQYLGTKCFQDLPTALYVAAYDINRNWPTVFGPAVGLHNHTEVAKAVRGSTAIPLGFRHETIRLNDGKDHGFWDGGVTCSMPLVDICFREHPVAVGQDDLWIRARSSVLYQRPDLVIALDASGATTKDTPDEWVSLDKRGLVDILSDAVVEITEVSNTLSLKLAQTQVANIAIYRVHDGASMADPAGTVVKSLQAAQKDMPAFVESALKGVS